MTSAPASYERKVQQSPDRDSCIKEFGRNSVKDNADGSWVCTVKRDKQKMLRAEQMMRGVRKEDAERGDYVRESFSKHKVVTKDGRVMEYADHLMDDVVRKNPSLKPPGRNGGAPSVHFGLSDVYKDFKQGPDGLWFRDDGGWLPTNFWRRDARSPQRDPDGNVWVEKNGEWLLEDEVA